METNKIFRRDLNQRDSKPNTVQSQQPTSPAQLKPPTTTNNNNINMPEYIKIPININQNPSNTGYLQPQPAASNPINSYNQSIQSGYLEPSNKPVTKVTAPTPNDPGYLEPANKRVEDSYGGESNVSSNGYLPPTNNNANNKQDTYMNEDFINELRNKKSPKIAEQEDDRIGDSYLIPRIGSNTSRASSTAPLLPRSGKNVYAPSPPLPQVYIFTYIYMYTLLEIIDNLFSFSNFSRANYHNSNLI